MNLTNPPPVEPRPPRLSISQLVAAVRDELENIDMARKLSDREPLFQLTKMEIEVQFVVAVDETIKGGFDVKVVSVGGAREASSENTQKVTLTYDLLAGAQDLPGARAHPGNAATTVSATIEPLR